MTSKKDLSIIMRKAWDMVKNNHVSMSIALKLAWVDFRRKQDIDTIILFEYTTPVLPEVEYVKEEPPKPIKLKIKTNNHYTIGQFKGIAVCIGAFAFVNILLKTHYNSPIVEQSFNSILLMCIMLISSLLFSTKDLE